MRDEQFERWREAEKAAAAAEVQAVRHRSDDGMSRALLASAEALRREADRCLSALLEQAWSQHRRAPKFESD